MFKDVFNMMWKVTADFITHYYRHPPILTPHKIHLSPRVRILPASPFLWQILQMWKFHSNLENLWERFRIWGFGSKVFSWKLWLFAQRWLRGSFRAGTTAIQCKLSTIVWHFPRWDAMWYFLVLLEWRSQPLHVRTWFGVWRRCSSLHVGRSSSRVQSFS